jgi:acyl carrier protein
VEGSRLYRTGDWCKWQADGNLVYTGRRDNQVKLRGQRIELEEIERVLEQAPGVGQAVVLVKGEELNRYLSAYIVSEGDFDKHAVQAYLRTQLPDYMVPAVLTALEQLPLTPNGKTDRKTLALIDTSPVSSHYKPPGSDTEQQLAEIWQRLLKTERISITSNFFESGGHSLMGMKVLADINKVFHTELSIKVLFQFPTIEKLAEYIDTICIDTDVADQTNFEVFEL